MSTLLQLVTLAVLLFLVRRVGAVREELRAFADGARGTKPADVEGAVLAREAATAGERDPATRPEAELPTAPEQFAGPWGRSQGADAVVADAGGDRVQAEAAPPAVVAPDDGDAAVPALDEQPRPKPAATRPRVDFEQRFGRRWAALLGGGAVAFGLALLVRHSIQQGYFPPSVRLAGAALLSFVLCAAAELFRRRGTFAIPGEASLVRRLADIPSILLGTGLAGLFAVAYAAHAVYGFLGAGAAFATMAAAALAGIAASLVYGPALAVLGYLAAEAVPFLIVGSGGMVVAAAYVALVGAAGYAAAYRARWRYLENPAGSILLLWAFLFRTESLAALALVALPASALAIAITVLRLHPRAAWTGTRQSRPACLALALTAGQGWLLADHFARARGLMVYEPVATALGFGAMLVAFTLAATTTRGRPMAPLVAATLVGALARLALLASKHDLAGTLVVGLAPIQVWSILAVVSVFVLAGAATTLHLTSRVSSTTALVGAASAAALLAGADLALHAFLPVDGRLMAGLALVQGLGLLLAARPRRGVIPPGREFASVAAASLGLGLAGLALVESGLGDGPRMTLVMALTAAGAAGLAVAWNTPLFASVAGIASLFVVLQSALNAVRTVLAIGGGEGSALWPTMQNTLLPGLVLAAVVGLLRWRLATGSMRDADRRWLALLGAGSVAGQDGPAASLVVTATAAGGLLLGALVAVLRWTAYGDVYAPLSAPTDVGLAAAFALGGSVACLRLQRATSAGGLALAAEGLGKFAMVLSGVALLANPFVTHVAIGRQVGLNLLVLAYLVPAALAWRLARDLARSPAGIRDRRMRDYAGGTAIAGLLAYATFAVSQAFQGPVLALSAITETELWTHTIVWLLLGVAVLAYGLRVGARVVRLAALGIVAIVAAKVVFIDLAHLSGAARAMSMIALGLVLLGIGMVYQRLSAAEGRV